VLCGSHASAIAESEAFPFKPH